MKPLSNAITSSRSVPRLRARQMLGKYRIEKRIGEGGFASVYAAMDTIEGSRVALKVPHPHLVSKDMLDLFRQEVRTLAKLDHPNVLSVKDASVIDGHFVVTTLLGNQTLERRLKKRLSVLKAFDMMTQIIEAVAYAHESGFIHCDIKPENFILFDDDVLKLADFGVARVARHTVEASGSGTLGHMAPEQAMGKPSFRSDVFALGLTFYRMLSGYWPQYPFDWPPPGYANLRRKHVHPDIIAVLRKSMHLKPHDRYADASRMQIAFTTAHRKAVAHYQRKRNS